MKCDGVSEAIGPTVVPKIEKEHCNKLDFLYSTSLFCFADNITGNVYNIIAVLLGR